MNEGEKSGLSSGQVFSSPNISGSQPQPNQAPVPMPEQPVDVTKIGNPALTTTVASMPEQDGPAKPVVTSGGDPIDKKKPRFGFATRRFSSKEQRSERNNSAFANAPEFFNAAIDDIVLAESAESGKGKKKLAIIGVTVVAVIGLIIGVVLMSQSISGNQKQAKATLANRLKNIIINGEDRADDIGEVSLDKPAAYQKFFIYKDGMASKDACEKTNALVAKVAKGNNLGALQEDIKSVCDDLGLRPMPVAVIISGAKELTTISMDEYIDTYYESLKKGSEKIKTLRAQQGHRTVELVNGLIAANCVRGGSLDSVCEYNYHRTSKYAEISRVIVSYDARYQNAITDRLRAIFKKIGGEKEANEK